MKHLSLVIFIICIAMLSFFIAPNPAKAASVSEVCSLSSQEQKQQEGIDLGYCDIINALPNTWIKDPFSLITAAVDYTAKAVGILALAGLIITGIMYITAGGDSDKAKKAQKNIGWIVTGLVIFLLLFWLPTMLNGFFNSLRTTNIKITPVDENGIEVAESERDTQGIIELWPNELPKDNLEKLKEKRALAVASRATISINNNVTSPKDLAVQEGTIIIWYNFDKVSHKYISDPKKPSTIKLGEIVVPARSYYVQFVDTPGEWHYTDANIPGPVTTTGSITVTENTQLATPSCQTNPSPTDSLEIIIDSAGISSDTSPVYSGTKVTWINVDDKQHTITMDRRSTMNGPKPAILQPGQSLSYIFATNGNVRTDGGQFIYFDETAPGTLYSICAFPLQQQGTVNNDTL